MSAIRIAIVGGGASGLCAAVRAARLGAAVTLLERQPRVGKKLLATGNGRCNLTNLGAASGGYHGGTTIMAEAMRRFPPQTVLGFFRTLGVEPLHEGDRIYPASEQASSVLDALRLTCDELGVVTLCGFEAARVDGAFRIASVDGRAVDADRLIMACGGPASPALSGTDSGLLLMASLGFALTPCLPALVQLRTDTRDIRALTGIRFEGGITLSVDGVPQRMERGEVLFTEYGLSGPAVLQVSRAASAALLRRKRPVAHLHILPEPQLALLRARRAALAVRPVEHFLTGMLNKRLGQVLLKIAGCGPLSRPAGSLTDFELETLAQLCADWPVEVTGTQGMQSAQVSAGGVRTDQFDPLTLESRAIPGLYAAGELLDVDGDCGGFNLQWAWASGLLAAECAARRDN